MHVERNPELLQFVPHLRSAAENWLSRPISSADEAWLQASDLIDPHLECEGGGVSVAQQPEVEQQVATMAPEPSALPGPSALQALLEHAPATKYTGERGPPFFAFKQRMELKEKEQETRIRGRSSSEDLHCADRLALVLAHCEPQTEAYDTVERVTAALVWDFEQAEANVFPESTFSADLLEAVLPAATRRADEELWAKTLLSAEFAPLEVKIDKLCQGASPALDPKLRKIPGTGAVARLIDNHGRIVTPHAAVMRKAWCALHVAFGRATVAQEQDFYGLCQTDKETPRAFAYRLMQHHRSLVHRANITEQVAVHVYLKGLKDRELAAQAQAALRARDPSAFTVSNAASQVDSLMEYENVQRHTQSMAAAVPSQVGGGSKPKAHQPGGVAAPQQSMTAGEIKRNIQQLSRQLGHMRPADEWAPCPLPGHAGHTVGMCRVGARVPQQGGFPGPSKPVQHAAAVATDPGPSMAAMQQQLASMKADLASLAALAQSGRGYGKADCPTCGAEGGHYGGICYVAEPLKAPPDWAPNLRVLGRVRQQWEANCRRVGRDPYPRRKGGQYGGGSAPVAAAVDMPPAGPRVFNAMAVQDELEPAALPLEAAAVTRSKTGASGSKALPYSFLSRRKPTPPAPAAEVSGAQPMEGAETAGHLMPQGGEPVGPEPDEEEFAALLRRMGFSGHQDAQGNWLVYKPDSVCRNWLIERPRSMEFVDEPNGRSSLRLMFDEEAPALLTNAQVATGVSPSTFSAAAILDTRQASAALQQPPQGLQPKQSDLDRLVDFYGRDDVLNKVTNSSYDTGCSLLLGGQRWYLPSNLMTDDGSTADLITKEYCQAIGLSYAPHTGIRLRTAGGHMEGDNVANVTEPVVVVLARGTPHELRLKVRFLVVNKDVGSMYSVLLGKRTLRKLGAAYIDPLTEELCYRPRFPQFGDESILHKLPVRATEPLTEERIVAIYEEGVSLHEACAACGGPDEQLPHTMAAAAEGVPAAAVTCDDPALPPMAASSAGGAGAAPLAGGLGGCAVPSAEAEPTVDGLGGCEPPSAEPEPTSQPKQRHHPHWYFRWVGWTAVQLRLVLLCFLWIFASPGQAQSFLDCMCRWADKEPPVVRRWHLRPSRERTLTFRYGFSRLAGRDTALPRRKTSTQKHRWGVYRHTLVYELRQFTWRARLKVTFGKAVLIMLLLLLAMTAPAVGMVAVPAVGGSLMPAGPQQLMQMHSLNPARAAGQLAAWELSRLQADCFRPCRPFPCAQVA